jgi:hypothetical protein
VYPAVYADLATLQQALVVTVAALAPVLSTFPPDLVA